MDNGIEQVMHCGHPDIYAMCPNKDQVLAEGSPEILRMNLKNFEGFDIDLLFCNFPTRLLDKGFGGQYTFSALSTNSSKNLVHRRNAAQVIHPKKFQECPCCHDPNEA